ncbi:hypothetical protein C2845_PM14G16200 [Panicum miliaceum]|uniref:Uncharacterized protein n=1 Tax=Panicum miliaceum TaxID=4540 RepID=A0A3L6PQJ0_PANMI|nr:hypothetical protein C2845_PM14G16200 [Panicum miliaceum]
MAYQALNDFSRQRVKCQLAGDTFLLPHTQNREQRSSSFDGGDSELLRSGTIDRCRTFNADPSVSNASWTAERKGNRELAHHQSSISQSDSFVTAASFLCPRRRTSSVAASFPDVTGRKPFFRCKNAITE